MTCRRLIVAGLLALLLGSYAAAEDEGKPLGKDEAERLLQQAAGISPAYMRTLMAIDLKTARKVLYTRGADAPLTASILALADGGELEAEDFAWLKRATPAGFTAAIYPETHAPGGIVHAKHAHASVLHPELIRNVVVKNDGARATGTIEFGAKDIFKGFAHWDAVRGPDGTWTITQFRFVRSGVRVERAGARWRLHAPGLRSQINPRRGTKLYLPRVGTVGIEPPSDLQVLVSVTKDGYIHVNEGTQAVSLVGLRQFLEQRTRAPETREQDGSSKVALLLDVDADMPWQVVQWVMQTAAHPAVKIWKIYFGVRASRDGAEGAIAALLPKDRSGPVTTTKPGGLLKVKAFHAEREGSDPRALYEALRKMPLAKRRKATWEIITPPPHGGKVPHGYIMQIMDAMLAAGARSIIFEGAAMPLGEKLDADPEALAAYLQALKARPGNAYIKLGSTRLAKDAPARDTPQTGRVERVIGAPAWDEQNAASITWGIYEPEIVEEVPEEPPPQAAPKKGASLSLDRQADQSVQAALRWLAAHQAPNGSWSPVTFKTWCDGKPVLDPTKQSSGEGEPEFEAGVTGLVLYAFLRSGYTNRGKHPFAKVVSRGLRYLKNVQDPMGCFGPRTTPQYVYNHACASLAMVEAYGRTGSPIFKGSAQRCLDYCMLCRNPYFAWRYGMKPGDNDTSITAWMYLALTTAEGINKSAVDRGKPAPLTIDASARDGVRAWLDRVTGPTSGIIGYTSRAGGSSRPQKRLKSFPHDKTEGSTAAGVWCRIASGVDPKKDKALKRSIARVRKLPPGWNPHSGQIDLVYWWWGTRVMREVGGKDWTAWRRALNEAGVASQRRDGTPCTFLGSWDPVSMWSKEGGRVFSTAMFVLSLSLEHRFLTMKPK